MPRGNEKCVGRLIIFLLVCRFTLRYGRFTLQNGYSTKDEVEISKNFTTFA